MIPPAPRTDPLELLYYGLLVGNVLVALVCGIVGPRVWARWLGATFLWGNGLLLLWVTVCLTHFALTTPFRDEAGFGFGLALMLTAPLVFEFLILLIIAVFRLRRSTASPSKSD